MKSSEAFYDGDIAGATRQISASINSARSEHVSNANLSSLFAKLAGIQKESQAYEASLESCASAARLLNSKVWEDQLILYRLKKIEFFSSLFSGKKADALNAAMEIESLASELLDDLSDERQDSVVRVINALNHNSQFSDALLFFEKRKDILTPLLQRKRASQNQAALYCYLGESLANSGQSQKGIAYLAIADRLAHQTDTKWLIETVNATKLKLQHSIPSSP